MSCNILNCPTCNYTDPVQSIDDEDVKGLMEKTTYIKTFYCSNCENSFTKSFEYGEVARKGKCPHCGVSDEQLLKPQYFDRKDV